MTGGLGRREADGTTGDEREGGQGRIRTADTRLFRPLLYHLSYLADAEVGTFGPSNPRLSNVGVVGGGVNEHAKVYAPFTEHAD